MGMTPIMDAARWLRRMDLEPMVVMAVLGIVVAVLLVLGYRYFSARRQRESARALRRYFLERVCPRGELAPHLRSLPADAPQSGPFPKEWLALEPEELDSPYYLRACRQVSWESRAAQHGWYDLTAWVQDVLAARADSRGMCAPASGGQGLGAAAPKPAPAPKAGGSATGG